MAAADMDLFIYRGMSSVPSIDFDCLRTLVYTE